MPENKSRDDASAVRVWLILWRAAHAIEKNVIHSVSGLCLGISDFAVLEVLLHKGPLPVNTIGKRVLLTSGSITSAIDRLEKKGLVRRVSDKEDRRARIVELTPVGKKSIEQAFQQHSCDIEKTLEVLSIAERKELIRLLKKAGLAAAARAEKLELL